MMASPSAPHLAGSGGSAGGGTGGSSASPSAASSPFASPPPSALQHTHAGGGGLKQYFYLSDLNKPVQIKIKSFGGPLTDLAERMLFEQHQQQSTCQQCGGTLFNDIPLQTELELYVSVSIWSRGAPLGLPAHTPFRAAHTPLQHYTPSNSNSNSHHAHSKTDKNETGENGGGSTSSLSSSGASLSASLSPRGGPGVASSPSSSLVGSSSLPEFSPSIPSTPFLSPLSSVRWNSWLQFPVQYRDLDHAARFGITIWCVAHGKSIRNSTKGNMDSIKEEKSSSDKNGLSGHRCSCSENGIHFEPELGVHSRLFAVGGCSLPIFNRRGLLKMGRRKLLLHSGVEGDASLAPSASQTLASTAASLGSTPSVTQRATESVAGLEKLEKLLREYEARAAANAGISGPGMGADGTQRVEWLDKLALRRIQKMQQSAQPVLSQSTPCCPWLTVELASFKHPIVYHQKTYGLPLPPILPEDPATTPTASGRMFVLHDPEVFRVNPIEHAYHKLARSHKGMDRDLKPNKKEREEIANIIASPNKQMSIEAKELLWKFRFSLTDDQRAVTKFLRCVNWSDVDESKQALELLSAWGPISPTDALELLSASFPYEGVRAYAVKQLQAADQEELGNYLLQLVQALRYEQDVPSFLSEFLIQRACQSMSLANFFHWYLCVEVHDAKRGNMYSQVLKRFMDALGSTVQAQSEGWLQMLEQQGRLIQQLIELGDTAKNGKGRVEKKVERMRMLLQPDGEFKTLRQFAQPIRVPVRPEIQVSGIVGEDSTMFKSALAPLLVCFTTPTPGVPYKVIFKSGDDLRQDQLIIQMINLMDSLLKKVKLDLQLTPYRVLATGPSHGFVEFVPNSHTLTSILDKYDKDIRRFLEQHNPKPQTLAKVLDTFVKSCASYCVITYILGIGDRHLDNVMLTTDGHLFHIDFSFIFGRDPKPFPPPMKFSKEMVEAMGGADSGQYQDFRKYCCLAFNILRQHANLILNLLSLMGDANIPDLSSDVEKNLLKVQEKFRLDLTDTEADSYILALIDQSVSALFPQMMEKIHKWALYWK